MTAEADRVVWKWLLPVTDEVVVPLPVGAQLLTVQEQFGDLYVWALVDPTAERVACRFRILGTGHIVDGDPGRYVGTAKTQLGALVWHVFADVATRADGSLSAPDCAADSGGGGGLGDA